MIGAVQAACANRSHTSATRSLGNDVAAGKSAGTQIRLSNAGAYQLGEGQRAETRFHV